LHTANDITLKEKNVFAISLAFLLILGVVSLLMSWYDPSSSWKFLLAFFPLFDILVGVAALRQSGLNGHCRASYLHCSGGFSVWHSD
jgi:hypothetical protein